MVGRKKHRVGVSLERWTGQEFMAEVWRQWVSLLWQRGPEPGLCMGEKKGKEVITRSVALPSRGEGSTLSTRGVDSRA